MEPIRLLIVDNNCKFHKLINNFFKDHDRYVVIGNALGGKEGLRLANQLKPDVVLLDIRMDDINGIEVIPQLKQIWPKAKIVMLTLCDMEIYRQAAKNAGAKGYVLKKDIYRSLIPAIEQVVNESTKNSYWECI